MVRDFGERLYDILSERPVEVFFNNVHTTVESYEIDSNSVMATRTDERIAGNCYVVSPYALTISYAKIEIHRLGNIFLRAPLLVLARIFSLLLLAFKIDRIQILENFMFSTNFFGEKWERLDIPTLCEAAIARHPTHLLAIRSLNRAQHSQLIERLSVDGWFPVVSRQVYTFGAYDFSKRDIVRDLELLRSHRFIFVEPENSEDFKMAQTLYEELYVTKYTRENIQYSALYMQKLCEAGLMHMRLLKDTETGEFVGVVGIVGDDNTLTAPIVGYRLARPADEALYRRCMMYIIKYAHDKNIFLNLSAGASGFKLNRGAIAEIEYMYVFAQHLSLQRRLMWRLLSRISLHVYRPLMLAYKL